MKKKNTGKRKSNNQDDLIYDVKNKWSQFWRRGKEPLTIMIAPHNEAKVIHFRISLLFLWLTVLITLALVASIVFLATSSQKQHRIINSQALVNQHFEASSKQVQEEIQALVHVVPAFEEALSTATTEVNNRNNADDLTMNNVTGDLKNQSPFMTPEEAANTDASALKRVRTVIESSLPPLKTIKDTLNSQKAFLVEMPTKWPLGNGLSGYVSLLFGPARDPFTGEWMMHTGVDIALGYGTPVVAAANGVVVKREFNAGGFGLYVIIRHNYGFSTRYGHLQRYNVSVGDEVKQGDIIGLMGATGRATGPHVHFEVMIGTEVVDPMRYLAINNQAYSRYIRDPNKRGI